MASVGRTTKTFENWRKDKAYAQKVDEARYNIGQARKSARDPEAANLSFQEWRLKYLGMETYWHQLQWIDMLEGVEPRDLHPSETYHAGNPKRILINTPPYHAKSATLTQQYVAYRICMNRDEKILIVSKTQKQAKKYLYSVKRYLTEPAFAALQAAYAPDGGFKPMRGGNEIWSSTQIIVAGRGDDAIDAGAKDPTVEAVGIGGHIQGSRANLIVIDDPEDDTNVAQWEKHLDWINEQIQSRLFSGRILVVTTRVAPVDLSSELLNGNNFPSGTSTWTYLGQPAVLEFADDPKDWVTMWPRSTTPLDLEDKDIHPDENGLWPVWDGPNLARVRANIRTRSWALLYMQTPQSDEVVFPEVNVHGSVDKRRKPGPLRPGEFGGRRNGAEGMHIIMSIDPAGTGEAFAMVYAIDRIRNPELGGNERWILNCWHRSGASSVAWYANLIEEVVPLYGVKEVVIEQNAYSSWLIHDDRIVQFCRNNGVILTGHYTSRNKQDPDLGVASMGPLFGSYRENTVGGRNVHNHDNLVKIPDPDKSYAIQQLIEQLINWQPGKLGKNLRQDGPMALWFAELRARNVAQAATTSMTHMPNKYLSRKDRSKQMVLALNESAYGDDDQ